MRPIRTVLGAIAALLAFGAPAFAQDNPLSYNGLVFDKRDGWCPAQVTAAGNLTLEIRNCANRTRYLSILMMRPAASGQTYDVANMAKRGADMLEGAEGKSIIEQIISTTYGSCAASGIVIGRNAVPGVPGFEFTATGTCTKDGQTQTVNFSNFSAYVVTPAGALWSVAFDHADGPITEDEHTMIKGVAERIAGR